MLLEFTRLMVGLFIAVFHCRIADFIFNYEEAFAATARQRGLPLPFPPKAETLRTIYFFIGVLVVLLELGRIWANV
ncbi:MAG: hypothetical protein ACJ71N_14740 [Terriglobales bacterium]|jgi:hypothetical protein